MDQWSETILAILPDTGRPLARADAEVLCTQRLATRLDRDAFRRSLAKLAQLRMVSSDATSLWRVEPDFEERALENDAERFLNSEECLSSLRVIDGTFVMQKTTSVVFPTPPFRLTAAITRPLIRAPR